MGTIINTRQIESLLVICVGMFAYSQHRLRGDENKCVIFIIFEIIDERKRKRKIDYRKISQIYIYYYY